MLTMWGSMKVSSKHPHVVDDVRALETCTF